jgi:rod shape-determining protein MreC
MRRRLQNAEVSAAKINILIDENNSLKQLLKFQDSGKTKMAVARVIGKNTDSTDQTILIDRGSTEGIKIGQPVIVGDGILVGKVIKAEDGISTVRLMNDSQFKIAATVLNNSRSLGVVEGGYGLSIKMNFIPRNETVMNGDQIITSGLEPNMPRGLLIGTVTAIENETYQPFQAAVLAPVTDLSKLYLVSVLLTN